MVTKEKIKIKDLTHGEFYSLQDAAELLNQPKHLIYNYAKNAGMGMGLLFNKYTVYTLDQVHQIGQILKGTKGGLS